MAKDTSIGIDIGSRYIKIVKLKKSGANIKIDDYIIHKLDFTPEESTSVDLKIKNCISDKTAF